MKWFKNLKIKVKLLVCFIVLAVVTGAVGLIGMINMNTINNSVQNMYTKNFIPAQNLAQVQKDLQLIRVNYYLMLFEQDPSTFQKRMDEITVWADENTKILDEYKKNVAAPEETTLYNTLNDSLAPYRSLRSECLGLIKDGKYQEAKAKTTEFGNARAAVDDNLEKLIAYNLDFAKKTAANNQAEFKFQSMFMISIVIASILIAIALGLFIANIISKPINLILRAANKIADGDLDVAFTIDTKDEVGILGQAFMRMTDTINDVMTNINFASEQVASGSKQMSSSSMLLSQGATEQASTVEQLTASLEEISVQTKLNASNANEASSVSDIAKENAVQGNTQMKEMLKAMYEINDASGNISKIIKVIDEIAFQTNILALNAAVEAARAGQHGKGFAVVAEEVRNLAARSANAAKETTGMIENSIKKVDDGTKIANSTAEALNKIVDGVAKVANLVESIAMASNEQATGIAQVNQGIIQVSQVIQTNSATSEESAAASEELASQAKLLKEQAAKFKLKNTPASALSFSNIEGISPEVLKMLKNLDIGRKSTLSTNASLSDNSVKVKKIPLSDNDFGKY